MNSAEQMAPGRDPTNARILIVDDQASNVQLLERLLRASGFADLVTTTDAREAIRLYDEMKPDLVLLDLHMPHLSGFTIMEQLRSRLAAQKYLPILVLTADSVRESRQRALAMGAKDFLVKPFDTVEVVLRIRNLLATRFRYLQLETQKLELEATVQARTRELDEARHEILDRLALAAEYRDDNTGEHTRRVGRLARALACRIGLPSTEADLIGRAAPLHDVGKIGIPDAILLKPHRLSPQEFEVIKSHTTIGARILSGSEVSLLRKAEEIARCHHERWDGRGYPAGLARDAIPVAGRIVGLADAFDAMTHPRPYSRPFALDEAATTIAGCAGSVFDPELVSAFTALRQDGLLEDVERV